MPDVRNIQLFVIAAIALAVTPGPAVLYVVTRSITQGRTAGVVSCFGVTLGGFVHVLAAALGVSAALATSVLAFTLVKYAGAAYLVWLGVRAFMKKPQIARIEQSEPRSLLRIFRDGVVVNILNPKTALFFLAFIPQFVTPSRGDIPLQCAFLGGLFVLIAFCTDVTWSLVASGAGAWLRGHPRFVVSERYVAGSVYLTLGLTAAFSGNARK
jgi:threonine/homoserine/homoserine lactone efflux protein